MIKCETVSPENTATNMQTKIRASPKGPYLHVGNTLNIRKDGVQAGGLSSREQTPGFIGVKSPRVMGMSLLRFSF